MGRKGSGRGAPQGGGQGQGRGPGRMGGSSAAGPGGTCVYPDCRHQVAHKAGQPCNSQKCPKCGALMTRE